MSCYVGPNTLNENLICHIDAGNYNSYNPNLVTTLGAYEYSFSGAGTVNPVQLDISPFGENVLCKHDLTGRTTPYLNVRVNTSIQPGVYTISCWFKATTTINTHFAFVGETVNEVIGIAVTVTTEWQRLTSTVTVVNAQTASRIQLFYSNAGENKIISVYGAQMVRGSDELTYKSNTGFNGNQAKNLVSNTDSLILLNNGVTYESVNGGILTFDGVNDTLQIDGESRFFTNYSQSITIETWVYIPTSATWTNGYYGNILSRGDYAGSHGIWRTTTNNQIAAYFRQSGTTFAAVQSVGLITRDTWYHLVASWDGSNLKLYINGILANSASGSLGTPTETLWYIGGTRAASGAAGNSFSGKQTSIKIYNRALISSEVLKNFNSLRGRFGL